MAPFGKKKKGNAAKFWLGPSKNANINMYGNQSTVNPSLNTNVRVFAGKGGLPPNDPVPGKNKRKYMLIDEEDLEIPTFNLMSSSQNTVQIDDGKIIISMLCSSVFYGKISGFLSHFLSVNNFVF